MENLQEKAKLLCTLGWRMAQCGAETRLIVQSIERMSKALNCKGIEISFSRSILQVKVKDKDKSAVEFKEIKHFGINMSQLTRLHQICLLVEKGEITGIDEIYHKIRAVRPYKYSKNTLIVIEGIAAAAFSYLNGGDAKVAIAALLGGIILMYFRFCLIHKGFFEVFAFMASAFIGCFSSFIVSSYVLDANAMEASLAIMATTLILVPGFPFMNGFLDVFKGYVEVGLIRLTHSAVLTTGASVGLMGAIYFSKCLGLN